jgi:hypothetical protein
MTTVLAEFTGQLTIRTIDRIEEAALHSAAELNNAGEAMIVVDAAGCFDPARMSRSIRNKGMDPAGMLRNTRILRAESASELEHIILTQLSALLDELVTRHVLIPDLLAPLYDPAIPTRDAARILGRIKLKLEELARAGANIVVLCRPVAGDLGTRAHFFSSLCASADRVWQHSS